ncbi:DUF6248 family natural product biosynthesis protein [Streptomyces bauhiniae]|uniref:DUF6248 family natural product biosynthesis protein n=1 Tax=Streptomyces bauhiniae TaxID=2340725 RepID=UPI0033252190
MTAQARRPQRVLTDEEWKAAASTDLLRLHGALILGIVDPVPTPSPMSEAEGAWVREHVWAESLREIDRKYPQGFYRWSMCERGSCWNCLNDRCDLCVHRQRGGPSQCSNYDWVHDHRGRPVAQLILRPDGSPCTWQCRCPCDKVTPAAPASVTTKPPTRTPSQPARWATAALRNGVELMALAVLLPGPDDLAEVVDALLAAADGQEATSPGRAARWRQLAHGLGDALDRLPTPKEENP